MLVVVVSYQQVVNFSSSEITQIFFKLKISGTTTSSKYSSRSSSNSSDYRWMAPLMVPKGLEWGLFVY